MKKLITLFLIFSTLCIMAQKTSKELNEKYHQFDFWLGKWDVYKYGTDVLAGKSNIESIIDSIGLLENYSNLKGTSVGKSLNKYNAAKERWEQYWIDNSGGTLHLTGKLADGKMVMNDAEYGDSKSGLNQIVWEKMKNGSVRQTWSLSKDGGKTWSVLFDGEYKRTKS